MRAIRRSVLREMSLNRSCRAALSPRRCPSNSSGAASSTRLPRPSPEGAHQSGRTPGRPLDLTNQGSALGEEMEMAFAATGALTTGFALMATGSSAGPAPGQLRSGSRTLASRQPLITRKMNDAVRWCIRTGMTLLAAPRFGRLSPPCGPGEGTRRCAGQPRLARQPLNARPGPLPCTPTGATI